MIDYYPDVLMIATASVWIWTARRCNRLIEAFRQRLPQVAERELDSVVGRSIKNSIFPFRHRAALVLRGDDVLWKLRQRFLFWAAMSVAVPMLGFIPPLIIMLSHQ
jgi:hypothetical protein